MTLSQDDGKLFYELMWKLQYHVNRKRGFHENINSIEEYAALDSKKKLDARNELWKDPQLIPAYVRENPDHLPAEQLRIIEKWTRFIKGSFFILRHLKKGSIFIKDDKVYSVHGIQDPLEQVIPSHALPQMVEAVLLPFKGNIVYDGLLMGYRVHFGGGIRSDLNHTYTVAKQKNRIIATLEPELAPPPAVKRGKNITPQLKEISDLLAKVKGNNALQNSRSTLPAPPSRQPSWTIGAILLPSISINRRTKFSRLQNACSTRWILWQMSNSLCAVIANHNPRSPDKSCVTAQRSRFAGRNQRLLVICA